MKFLHTADWQIGMRAAQLGDLGQRVSAARLDTIERIVELANAQDVDFVLIAGDQFEHVSPAREDVVAVATRLQRLKMPTYVIPGNHDPGGAGSLYQWAAWTQPLANSQVQTILESATIELPGGGVLLASPCNSKYSAEDPTAWFAKAETAQSQVRIGMAHGTLQRGDIASADSSRQQAGFPIALDAASRANLSYLALGHFHAADTLRDGAGLIAYSGTPEQTAFDDHNCGAVNIVTVAGGVASVTPVRVGTYHWEQMEIPLHEASETAALRARFEAFPDPAHTLLRVKMRGLCTPSSLEQIQALLLEMRERFCCFEDDVEYQVQPETQEAWLELVPPGILSDAASDLWKKAAGSEEDRVIAIRALQQLVEICR